jgi:hypothetical protein
MPFQPGDIVVADIADPEGNPCGHRHPAMVLRSSPSAAELWLVGISTSFGTPLPNLWLPLPHDKNRHPITGLIEPCVLKCNWVVRFPVTLIAGKIGIVPTEIFERAVELIIAEVERKRANPHGGHSS